MTQAAGQQGALVIPRAAASAAIFRERDVLLIRRGGGALKGYWSLPGGHIEAGEPAAEAARREVLEETGVDAVVRQFLDMHEVFARNDTGQLVGHYVIAVFAGLWQSGEPVAGGDAAEAGFYSLAAASQMQLTPGAMGFIGRAADVVLGNGDGKGCR